MTHTLSAQQARNTTVFIIEKGEVVETTLYDHVMKSAEWTTTRNGNGPVLFIREQFGEFYKHEETGRLINEDTYKGLDEAEQDEYVYAHDDVVAWQLIQWINNGQNFVIIDWFKTEEDAEDALFNRIYDYDFLPDDQRDTDYWDTREEAEEALAQREAE